MPPRRLTYQGIADDLADRIKHGEYPPDQQIPSYGTSVVLTATDRPAKIDLNGKAVQSMLTAWWQSLGSDPASVSVLVKATGCSERTFHRARKALIDKGMIAAEGRGNQVRYRLLQEPDQQ